VADYETILVGHRDEGVCLITLNRPHRLNAASMQMYADLTKALDSARADDGVRVLVVTGAARPDGRPAFCAGLDLKERVEAGSPWDFTGTNAALDAFYWQTRGPGIVFDQIESLPKPSIAAIDGICTTWGLELALACDMRVVSESAQISDLHTKQLGTVNGAGGFVRLTRLVGPAVAKEILMTGDVLDGLAAVRLGLANHVYPPGQMLEGALALATRMARMRPEALAVNKAMVDAAAAMGTYPTLRLSQLARTLLASSDDAIADWVDQGGRGSARADGK
jgi:enoyl-CoA hydratase